MPSTRDRFQGCLLGGAVGDALGGPVEFMSLADIHRKFGEEGITDYAPAYGRRGAITDDTQMTLFTAEGLIRATVRLRGRGLTTFAAVTAHAYQRWLTTQSERSALCAQHPGENCDGWLMSHQELHHRRAPGNTCLGALRRQRSFGERAVNDSKGCGGVMRVAPAGLFASHDWQQESPIAPPLEASFNLGVELAAQTHGHPTGSLAAGAFAATITSLVGGSSLVEALRAALELVQRRPNHEETSRALRHALELAAGDVPRLEAIERLGQGWVAEEALAIGAYCALVASDFRDGVVLAVNHDGDSDSTGSIAGNLMGTVLGVGALPQPWLEGLELRDVIAELAGDLLDCWAWDIGERATDPAFNDRIFGKYPGW